MRNLTFFLFFSFALSSCNSSAPSKGDKREMFDAGGLQVITSFANHKDKTMSTLYGNGPALKSALSGYKVHLQGEEFKLVVFRQVDNKYWYGSYQNGKLLSVESIKSVLNKGGQTNVEYHLEQGSPPKNRDGNVMISSERISYVFAHRPSAFPN